MKLKNNYLLKKLLKWASKKYKNFYIYNIVFLKKILMIWSTVLEIEFYRLKLVIMGHFLPFYLCPHPLKASKIRIKKIYIKKMLEISFYTCVPKTTIIWGMVPGIWIEKDRIFCHLWPFFALLPPNNLENKNFEKMKKKQLMISF